MRNYKNILFIILTVCFVGHLNAEGDKGKQQNKLYKTKVEPHYAKFNINNISTFIYNNGQSDIERNGNSGFVYPKGTGKTCFYESGLVWGGKIKGEVKVGGSTYRSGLIPGKILDNGEAENPALPHVRIYRVRRDYKTENLSEEAEDEGKAASEIYSQYEKDWNEWRIEDGAPFEDIDGNGIYNPLIDIPGIPGADQTIWYVANDLDSNKTKELYGSLPIGIEMQATFWGYKSTTPLGNIMFRKYIVINKSENNIDSMYFSMWSDSEIGGAGDDLVGCDTTLNMTFGYNGFTEDVQYSDSPPAAGFVLLQGPVTNGEQNDEATFLGRKIKGKKNIEMTSFHYFYKCCPPEFGDPTYNSYENGTLIWYNYMQGLGWNGLEFLIPDEFGGRRTKLPLSGNPITREGFIDGIAYLAGDRRMGLGTGPFTIAPGDTQEVIYAQLAAGTTPEINRLEAIKYLRYYANFAQELYDNNFKVSKITKELIPPLSLLNEGTFNDINLTWDNELNKNTIEKFEQNGYKFQGYNLYQTHFDDPYLPDAKRRKVVTYDIIDGVKNVEGMVPNPESGYAEEGIIQSATDSGIKREFVIDKDYSTGLPLAKGKKYYFSLTAYFYNADENKIYETPKGTIEFIYKELLDGPSYRDSIFIKNDLGSHEGIIYGTITVPELLTGDDYKIEFEEFDSQLYWNLFDQTTGQYSLTKQELISYSEYRYPTNYFDVPIADGIQFYVIASDPDAIEEGGIVEVSYGGGPLPENAWDELGSNFGGNSVLNDENWNNNGNRDSYKIIYDLSWKRYYSVRNKNYRDFEIRFTDRENFGFGYYRSDSLVIVKTPFEIWDIGVNTPFDNSDDIRMIPRFGFFWNKGSILEINSQYSDDVMCSEDIWFYDPETPDGYSRFEEEAKKAGGAGAFYPYKKDGSISGIWINMHDERYLSSASVIDYLKFCDLDNDGKWPESGTVIRIYTQKNYTDGESYSFKAPAKTLTQNSYKLFQNYPNPFNPATTIRFFIPEEGLVKIDIFNILGQKVKTIINEKLYAGAHEKTFNRNNLSSGVYIYSLQINDKLKEVKKMVLLK